MCDFVRAHAHSAQERKQIAGVVQLDMISWRKTKQDKIFQISPGDSSESLKLAKYAYLTAAIVQGYTEVVPQFWPRYDRRSYLYNTDGLMYSDAGYPVILINEHLNYWHNFGRPGYHTSQDTVELLDQDYGATIAMIVIETVAQLANARDL